MAQPQFGIFETKALAEGILKLVHKHKGKALTVIQTPAGYHIPSLAEKSLYAPLSEFPKAPESPAYQGSGGGTMKPNPVLVGVDLAAGGGSSYSVGSVKVVSEGVMSSAVKNALEKLSGEKKSFKKVFTGAKPKLNPKPISLPTEWYLGEDASIVVNDGWYVEPVKTTQLGFEEHVTFKLKKRNITNTLIGCWHPTNGKPLSFEKKLVKWFVEDKFVYVRMTIKDAKTRKLIV